MIGTPAQADRSKGQTSPPPIGLRLPPPTRLAAIHLPYEGEALAGILPRNKEQDQKAPPWGELQTVKKVYHSVIVIRRRQTVNRKSASPFGALNGAKPLRGDFRAFPSGKASLHERTAGSVATSE